MKEDSLVKLFLMSSILEAAGVGGKGFVTWFVSYRDSVIGAADLT